MPIYVDRKKNKAVDIPPNLPGLPRKFYLTAEDIFVPGETDLNYIAEAIDAGNDEYKEFGEWYKLVMKRLMMEDKTTHTMRTSRGRTLYEGAGISRQPVEVFQSRWLLPKYQKSITEGAEDAPEDYWFKWLDANYTKVMRFAALMPTEASEGEPLSQATIDKRLHYKNPKRKKALGWIKELVEEHRDTFTFLPKKKTETKETK